MSNDSVQSTEGTPATPQQQAAAGSLGDTVDQVVRALDELPAGDLADLRRLDPREPGAAGFWKLAVRYLEPAGVLPSGGPGRALAERRWASLLSAVAIARGLHRRSRRLGESLAQAQFSELRFVRLLRARGGALFDAVRLVARFLASKGESADFADLARLVLSEDQEHAEDVRRAIAREYYRAANASERRP